jgi:hypothetical protein
MPDVLLSVTIIFIGFISVCDSPGDPSQALRSVLGIVGGHEHGKMLCDGR